MYIKKVVIQNFKCFSSFELDLKKDINIIVGDNEAGKSTILEAINLALTGILHGRYLKYETLSQYLFNHTSIENWQKNRDILPSILIEIYFDGVDGFSDASHFKGTNNSKHTNEHGLSFSITFNEEYREEYNDYIKQDKDINTLPIEYYDKISWKSFADASITARSIPIKSALIDSTNSRYQDGSDIYINRIIKEGLGSEQKIQISQAHRNMKNGFQNTINSMKPISTNEKVKVCVNLKTQNAWEEDLITHVDNTPFHYIGKGQQCITKTELSLGSKKGQNAGVILLEEPENHLSHSKLNTLIKSIVSQSDGDNHKQIIISTHSSFVANKLNLKNLILLHKEFTKHNVTSLHVLPKENYEFFQKLPGYDTLRLLLCKSAILVEGTCDELIVQAAYMKNNNGKLPIEDEIDVISVGKWSMVKHFKPLVNLLNKRASFVTDNDGDVKAKYIIELEKNNAGNIKIYYGNDNQKYTLEVCMFKDLKDGENNDNLKTLLSKQNDNDDDVIKWMISNKTDWALNVFNQYENINFPQYILDAIKYAKGEK